MEFSRGENAPQLAVEKTVLNSNELRTHRASRSVTKRGQLCPHLCLQLHREFQFCASLAGCSFYRISLFRPRECYSPLVSRASEQRAARHVSDYSLRFSLDELTGIRNIYGVARRTRGKLTSRRLLLFAMKNRF